MGNEELQSPKYGIAIETNNHVIIKITEKDYFKLVKENLEEILKTLQDKIIYIKTIGLEKLLDVKNKEDAEKVAEFLTELSKNNYLFTNNSVAYSKAKYATNKEINLEYYIIKYPNGEEEILAIGKEEYNELTMKLNMPQSNEIYI